MQHSEVIKHSSAIQISNTITLLQRRAWNVMLAYAYDDLLEADTHTMRVADLMAYLDLSSNNDAHLKDVLRGLADTAVEWNILGKDGTEVWGRAALLADVEVKSGVVEYSYGGILRRRLYNPTVYARIKLSIQNRFGSKHALALYELLVDYVGVGQTKWVEVGEFRRLMGLGVGEYSEFKHLNAWVVKRPLSEINKLADVRARVEYKRERRRVVAIKFYVRPKVGLKEKLEKPMPQKGERPSPREDRRPSLPVEKDEFDLYYEALPEKERQRVRGQAEELVDQQPNLFGYSREAEVWYRMRQVWRAGQDVQGA